MRAVRAALMLALVLLTTGCWDVMPVEELGFVTLILMDHDPKGQVHLVLHLADAGAATSKGPGEEPVTLEATGSTFFEALHTLDEKSSRHLFFGVLQGLVVTERAATTSAILSALDFFIRDVRSRDIPRLYLVRDDDFQALAKIEITEAEFVGRSLSTQSLLADLFSDIKPIRFYEFARESLTEGRAPMVPVLKPSQNHVTFAGQAVFYQGRFVGELPADALWGVPWISRIPPLESYACLKMGQDCVGVLFAERSKGITPIRERGVLRGFRLSLRANLVVQAVEKGEFDLLDAKSLDLLTKTAAQKVLSDVTATLRATQAMGVDVGGFGFRLHQVDDKMFEAIKDRWDKEIYPQIPIEVSVSIMPVHANFFNRSIWKQGPH